MLPSQPGMPGIRPIRGRGLIPIAQKNRSKDPTLASLIGDHPLSPTRFHQYFGMLVFVSICNLWMHLTPFA